MIKQESRSLWKEGGALVNGISAFVRDLRGLSLPLFHNEKYEVYNQDRAYTKADHDGLLISNVQPPEL